MGGAVGGSKVRMNMENASTPPTRMDNNSKSPVLQHNSISNKPYALFASSAYTTSPLASRRVQSKTLTEFHYFRKLPIELRCMIWHLSLSGPRSVDIGCHKPCISDPDGEFEEVRDRDIDSPTFPIALQINHESRAEALKKYHIIHRHGAYREDNLVEHDQGDKKPVCVNPAIDHVFFMWNDVHGREEGEFEWMRSMAEYHPAVYHAITEVEVRGVDFEKLQFHSLHMAEIFAGISLERKYSTFGTTFCLPNIEKLKIHFDLQSCLTKCPGMNFRANFTADVLKFINILKYTSGSKLQIEMHIWQTLKEGGELVEGA